MIMIVNISSSSSCRTFFISIINFVAVMLSSLSLLLLSVSYFIIIFVPLVWSYIYRLCSLILNFFLYMLVHLV